jgi:MFS family permease
VPQGLQTLVALLILLPGFVSARIARSLSAQAQQSELERVIEALIFSFFTYVVYVALFGTSLPIEWLPSFQVHRWRIVFLAVMACGIGVFWGIVRSKDLALRLLRKWKLTERTSRESVWNDVFSNIKGSAQVGLEDGRNLIGWIGRYSDSGGERSLFVEKASWVLEDGTKVKIEGKGILLTNKAEIEYVMFLDEQFVNHEVSAGE